MNGGGSYIPNLGAPWPFLKGDPIRGAPPVIFLIASIASGRPILASYVPKNPPYWLLVDFTTN